MADAVSWVFGYGSLVSPSSLGRTLGREVSVERDWTPGVLRGFGRRWNYGSLHLRADWQHDGVVVERGLVVSLGLVEGPEWCNGVLVRVTAEELSRLDHRERDYDRVDVTDAIETTGAVRGRVVTYVPRVSAVQRYETHRAERRAAVNQRYVELVGDAFSALGDNERARFDESTPMPDVPVLMLDPFDTMG